MLDVVAWVGVIARFVGVRGQGRRMPFPAEHAIERHVGQRAVEAAQLSHDAFALHPELFEHPQRPRVWQGAIRLDAIEVQGIEAVVDEQRGRLDGILPAPEGAMEDVATEPRAQARVSPRC